MNVLINQWTVPYNYVSQINPALAIGIGAVVGTALVALSFTCVRQEPQAVVPTATQLNLPQSERTQLDIQLNILLNTAGLQVNHRINRQIDPIKNVAALEGNIVDNRKTSENAQQILNKLTGDFDAQWRSLNRSERVAYYTPTALLRSGLGCVLRFDSEKVYSCMTRKSTINACQNIIQGCDESVATIYRRLVKSLVDLPLVDKAQVYGRTHIKSLMETYKVAKQLKKAADSSWWAVEGYRWADDYATTLERKAEKDKTVSTWAARLDADFQRNKATSQISTVQQLSRKLDSALKNVDAPRMKVKAIQNPLQGAADSINNYDFWERMTDCHVHGFLHNLFEDLNNIKIKKELAAIGKNAASIQENLIDLLVDLLESKRSVCLATDAGRLLDSKAFRRAASSYVRNFAQDI